MKYQLKTSFKIKFSKKECLIDLASKKFYSQMDLLTILKKLNGIIENFPKQIIRNPKFLNSQKKIKNEKNNFDCLFYKKTKTIFN